MAKPNIGWIGIGQMGTPMCRNLLRAGYAIFAYDIDASRLAAVVADGATAVANPSEVAKRADIVISMVRSDKILLSIVEGVDGVAKSIAKDKIFVDMSTVSPAASAQVAGVLEPTGCHYLRAAVSGSTLLAEKAALSIYCSGNKEAAERCEPVFAKLGTKQTHAGLGEEAKVLKLVINLIVEITPVVLGEALAFGLKGGLEWSQMVDAIGQSVVASPLLAYKTEILKARDWTPTGPIDLVGKDLDLAIDFGRANNLSLPFTALVRQFYAAFQASGEGELDFFAVTTWPERMLAKAK